MECKTPEPHVPPKTVQNTSLHYFGKYCIAFTRLSGYFPYHLFDKKKLQFRWCSWSVVYLILTFVYSTGSSILLFPMFKDFVNTISEALGATDNVAFRLQTLSHTTASLFLRMEALAGHKKFLKFWERLDSSFEVLLTSAFQSLAPGHYAEACKQLHCRMNHLTFKVVSVILAYEAVICIVIAPLFVHEMGFGLTPKTFLIISTVLTLSFYSIGYISNSILLHFLISVLDQAFEIIDHQIQVEENSEDFELSSKVW